MEASSSAPAELRAASVDDGFWGRLHRYLVGSYMPTLMHALFHLMGVLLAFIMASAWAARETDLKDTRTELAVLKALANEASALHKRAQDLNVGPTYKDCPRTFYLTDKKDTSVFSAPVWQSVYVSDHALIIGSTLYDKFERTYSELGLAPTISRLYSPSKCAIFLRQKESALLGLAVEANKNIKEAEDKLGKLDGALWSPRYDRHIKYTLFAWILIILSPAGFYVAELIWKDQVAARLSLMPMTRVYAQVVGILLLLLVGVAGVLTHSWLLQRNLALHNLLHLAGGVGGAYTGFWGPGARVFAQASGIAFTLAGIVGLIMPTLAGRLPAPVNTASNLLYLAIGLWGVWVGFTKDMAPA